MKKILIVTLEYPPKIGGIATYVHQLAAALPPENTIVLAPKHPDSASGDSAVAYTIIRRDLFYSLFWPRWIKLFFAVRDIAKTHAVELVMVHHVLPAGYAAYLLKLFSGVPYLVFSHGTDVLAATKTWWKRAMATMILKKTDQLIFNSESLKKRLLEVLPQFGNKSTVMYPCPDADFMIPPNADDVELLRHKLALEGKRVILSIARLDEGKGFPHLVRAMPKVLEKVPNLVWVVIGNGPKRDEIYTEIEKNNLQNVVRYMGDVPHSEIKKYLSLAEVFVLFTHPERDGREEGLGLVFLEAAAAGKPAIAGKSGGVEEGVIHGRTGMVVDVYGDLDAAGETIVTLLKDTVLADALGKQAQERIRTDFVWEKQLDVIKPWIS